MRSFISLVAMLLIAGSCFAQAATITPPLPPVPMPGTDPRFEVERVDIHADGSRLLISGKITGMALPEPPAIEFVIEGCNTSQVLGPVFVGPIFERQAALVGYVVRAELTMWEPECMMNAALRVNGSLSPKASFRTPRRPSSAPESMLSVTVLEEILRDHLSRVRKFGDEYRARSSSRVASRAFTTEDALRRERFEVLIRADEIMLLDLYPAAASTPVAMPGSLAELYGRLMLEWARTKRAFGP